MPKGQRKIQTVMHEFHAGALRSSAGETVTSPRQAAAVALSEARATGARLRRRPQGSGPMTDADMARGYRAL